jgi:hypothetical protein
LFHFIKGLRFSCKRPHSDTPNRLCERNKTEGTYILPREIRDSVIKEGEEKATSSSNLWVLICSYSSSVFGNRLVESLKEGKLFLLEGFFLRTVFAITS